ncbi:MAG: hypothetical protein ACOYMN_26370, partial [Roseimicrobium sp.]
MSAHPLHHRCHDYPLLAQRWKTLAETAGWHLREFARAEEQPVYAIETHTVADVSRTTPWLYLSAGVHGDEAAPPWGLLEWAEMNVPFLREQPALIFPTLNPNGLLLNTRADHRGVDLNRQFNSQEDPLILAWRSVVGTRPWSMALCLHEDYDAQGCYIYELTHRADSVGEHILRDTSSVLPTDNRETIDGVAAVNGLIIRRVPPELPGLPEAIVLHYLGVPVTLTFESPSEFCLTDRVAV